jgi:hypothetical protein
LKEREFALNRKEMAMSKDLFVRVCTRGMYLAAGLMVMGLLTVSAKAQTVQLPDALPTTALAQSSETPAAEAIVGSYYDDAVQYYNLYTSYYYKWASSKSDLDLAYVYYYAACYIYNYYMYYGYDYYANYYYNYYYDYAQYYADRYYSVDSQYYRNYEQYNNIALGYYNSYMHSGSNVDMAWACYNYAFALYYYYMYTGQSDAATYYYNMYMDYAEYYYYLP